MNLSIQLNVLVALVSFTASFLSSDGTFGSMNHDFSWAIDLSTVSSSAKSNEHVKSSCALGDGQ